MRYYPLFLDLKDKVCCVVGGGRIAERKVRVLLKCLARVLVVSRSLTAGLEKLRKEKKIVFRDSGYSVNLLAGVSLVIAATDDRLVNSRVSVDCRKRGIPVNVVDLPGESSFIVPAFAEKNGLIIAVSTSGQAPCLAKKIRKDLNNNFLPRYAGLLKELALKRSELKITCPESAKRKSVLNSLLNSKFSRKAGSG